MTFRNRNRGSTKHKLALATALALVGYAGSRGKLRRYEIAETSMRPALRPGDYVIAQVRTKALERGDVVIVHSSMQSDLELVKRVVGLPTETIVISNGQVHANDAVLAEPWADGPTWPDGQWQLGAAEVFVLGDSRASSMSDSRQIGPIHVDEARWKVVGRYWPLSDIGRI